MNQPAKTESQYMRFMGSRFSAALATATIHSVFVLAFSTVALIALTSALAIPVAPMALVAGMGILFAGYFFAAATTLGIREMLTRRTNPSTPLQTKYQGKQNGHQS